MNAPGTPRYDWGQRVAARQDLYNDGSHPGSGAGALLVPHGSVGEVVQVGLHEASGTPVYMVEFGGCVVGCFEDEIAAGHPVAHQGPPEPLAAPVPAAPGATR